MTQPNEGISAAPAAQYTCGTLRYTAAGLVSLFGWLLWGHIAYLLMEEQPKILILQLKQYQISDKTSMLLLQTTASLCSVSLLPAISFYSDRYRSRWGRRRPFLMAATPFVVIFLSLIPWAPEITHALTEHAWAQAILTKFPASPLVLMFAVLLISFRIVDSFISSIYYYLVNDTVPGSIMGRFYAYFAVSGILANMVFNWFFYPYALEHIRFFCAFFAIVFGVSFIFMCWRVPEGEYDEVVENRSGWYAPLRNYVVQCFGSPRNCLIFLVYAAYECYLATGLFTVLFYTTQVGLSLKDYGRLLFYSQIVGIAPAWPIGHLIDRLGSEKTFMIGLYFATAMECACVYGIHDRTTAFVLGIALYAPVFLLITTINKWKLDMYGRAHFGQLASAGALLYNLILVVLSPCMGALSDWLGHFYQLCFICPGVSYGIAFLLSLVLYRRPVPTPEPTDADLGALAIADSSSPAQAADG